jgi:hypothetical protein
MGPCAMEIKPVSSPSTVIDAQTTAKQLQKLTYCSFGDEMLKKGVKSQYQVQCTHHACVMRIDLVLFVVASDRNIIYVMLIVFQQTDLDMYDKLLGTVSASLDWIYGDEQFPTESFGGGLKQNGSDLDVHAVRTQLLLWKSNHTLIERHAGQPLPAC